ncbi:hypothetical protein [Streptomyces phaeochromogenes]|uniref:hypothetical protein n=1 Tax=Streptomyces phaeochromogenes TaxID=1923 RepID=UPI0038691276|nr:hypothetical protein OHB08_01720 [Streptomyces phaeochromogenes]
MRLSRPDSGGPPFPGPPRTVTDARVRAAVQSPEWPEVSAGTRAALAEFYGGSGRLDDEDFDERLEEIVDTHGDLQHLVQHCEVNDDSRKDPRGVDMPPVEDPGNIEVPDPFATPDAALLRQPPPDDGTAPAAGGGGPTASDGRG